MEKSCLVIADADKIHDYVFSPRKLKLIRGGSAIQRQLNKEILLLQLSRLGSGNLRGTEILDEPTVEDGADWEVVFAGGGTVMCHFRDRPKAEAYCLAAERLFYERTGLATITPSLTEWDESFDKTLPIARQRLEIEKAGARRRMFSGHTPYWKNCENCGSGNAGATSEERCSACEKRFAESASPYFRKVNQKLGGSLKEPDDFQAISSDGYLAMVYIDGDAMGEYLQVNGSASKQHYRKLSKEVQETVEGGVIEACTRLRPKADSTAAFEILLVGGDDAIVMLAAEQAIDFVLQFDAHWTSKNKAAHYSAGIVWAHHHFPISQFLGQAEVLLRSAKRKAGVNSVDYRVISEAMAQDEMPRANDPTTAKPYKMEELGKLWNGVSGWKAEQMPANKINHLYRIAFEPQYQANIDYKFLLSRLKQEHANQMKRVVGSELIDPETGRTKAADAAELWSLI
jgi:Cas10/Cmr2, second palm domain